jgi:formylglycine-generating enzyme required for sulfatase activity
LDRLAASTQISHDETDLLQRALAGQQGDTEKTLAERLVMRQTLSPEEWRDYSALAAPANPVVAKLRPLLAAGEIREKEFSWLATALAGGKGGAELTLAQRLVDLHDLTPAQWRAQTALYPPPPVDPVVEKVKPFFVSGRITAGERSWLEQVLRGKKGAEELALAAELLDRKTITALQWRARTSLAYPYPAAEALDDPAHWPPAIDLPLNGTTGLRLLRVEAGVFLRGTPKGELGRRNNEPLPSPVRIEQPYYLGVTEITQAQFTAVIPRNPSYWRGHADWPADQVDWQSLCGPGGFLDRLNRRLGRNPGNALVADVPTSDEWEYACRAGTQTSFYQGGAIADLQRDPTLDHLANYGRSDSGTPVPVASFAPNAWGFYDMLGNMAEWCRDRVIRGGSWQSNAAGCRIGWFTQSNPDADTDPSPTLGFRLVLRAKPTEVPAR